MRENSPLPPRVAILVYKNHQTAAMLLTQANLVGVQLYAYVNTFFYSNKFAWRQVRKTPYS